MPRWNELYEPEITLSNGEKTSWTSEFEVNCKGLLQSQLGQLSEIAKEACCTTRPHIPIDDKVFVIANIRWSLVDHQSNGYRIASGTVDRIKRNCVTPADYALALRTIDEAITWCTQQGEARKAAARDMLESQRDAIEELRVRLVKRKLKTGH